MYSHHHAQLLFVAKWKSLWRLCQTHYGKLNLRGIPQRHISNSRTKMEDLDFQTEIKLLNGLYSTTHTAPLLAVCKIKAEPILYKVHPGGYFFRDTISLDEIDTLSCAKMARFQPRWVSSTPFWYSLLSTWFYSRIEALVC